MRNRAFPREGCFPIQGERGLAILRTPVHPTPSFPALRRGDNTYPWNADDRIEKGLDAFLASGAAMNSASTSKQKQSFTDIWRKKGLPFLWALLRETQKDRIQPQSGIQEGIRIRLFETCCGDDTY